MGLSVPMADPLQKDFKLKSPLALNLAQTSAALECLRVLSSQEKRQQPRQQPLSSRVAHLEEGLPSLVMDPVRALDWIHSPL